MAYLTIVPTSARMEVALLEAQDAIVATLQEKLPHLGVAPNDILVRIESCSTLHVHGGEHIEVFLKTDNVNVTADQIVKTLERPLLGLPFEVSRLHVGYFLPELWEEVKSFFYRKRRNWASNYMTNMS
jgi:hypothetical protein